MGIEEGTFWDEHWVLYGNQFDNKFHILKKKIISGHDLMVPEFEPYIRLSAVSMEPTLDPLSTSLCSPQPQLVLSLSKIYKH